jgi:DNA polymerase elongation subunit (family B)
LLSKLFNCNTSEEVRTTGYKNALSYITQSINKLMNGEVQITDLLISKLLRQNIEKYRALFPHVAAAIRLNVFGVITNRGDNIQYVHTDSNHTDPLYRITPAKRISSQNYDREKYLEMLLDSAEAVLAVFGFNRSMLGFDKKFKHWFDELYQQRERYRISQYGVIRVVASLFPYEDVTTRIYTSIKQVGFLPCNAILTHHGEKSHPIANLLEGSVKSSPSAW